MFAINEASEIRNRGDKRKENGNPINQSSKLNLLQNENLKKLLENNIELNKEVKETEELINTPLKIKTIEKLDKIVNEMTQLGFKTGQEAKEKAESSNKIQTEEDLKSYLNAKKFCYYKEILNDFLDTNLLKTNDKYDGLFGDPDQDLRILFLEINGFCKLNFSNLKCNTGISSDHALILNNPSNCIGFVNHVVNLCNPKIREFVIRQLSPKLCTHNDGLVLLPVKAKNNSTVIIKPRPLWLFFAIP